MTATSASLRSIVVFTFVLGFFAMAGENAPSSPDFAPFRISAEDPCVVSRFQNASVLDLRAVKIECDNKPCAPFDKTFRIPAGAWKRGGVVAKASVDMGELAKFFAETPNEALPIDNLLVELRVCDATKPNSPCGDNSQQLMRMKGAYLLPLSASGNHLQLEVWVDPRRIASAQDLSSCPKR